MTEEENAIEKMYEEGLVNVSKIAEPLINKYKELDYQQCQFVIEYLLADRQFNEEYVDELEADIDRLEKNIDNLIKEQEEIEKYIHKLEEKNKELDLKDKENKAVTYNFEKTVDKLEIAYKVIDLMADKLSERNEWYTKERWKEICYKQVEEKDE